MNKLLKQCVLISALCVASSVMAKSTVVNSSNPEGYKQFKIDYEDMIEIANPTRLKWRMFYVAPSQGPDAEWFDAVKQGNLDLIKKMVKNGQNIEAKDEAALGQTALGWAAFIGYEDIVDYLIEQKADLFATDRGDVTNALKSAGLGKSEKVFKKIYARLKDKVDLNDQKNDKQGETILIVAASNDRDDIVEFLLKHGANPNLVTTVQDKSDPAYNQSAFSFACDRGNARTIEVLVKHGAINHRNGKSSCDY
jgi:ankyrin repeat protein